MSLLYRSLTIARIWALLEAYPPFTNIVIASNQIDDTESGWLQRFMLRAPGDFPRVQVEMGDNFGGGAIPTATFSDESPSFGDEVADYWIESRSSDFKISIIYELAGSPTQDALEMAIIEALERGGRDLGYTPIQKWGPWRGRRNGTSIIGGVDRPVTQIVFPVTYEFTGSELKPSTS